MAQDDPTPHALVGRAGLVFAYVSFGFALAMFGGAAYLLPLSLKARLFLAGGAALLILMFAGLAVMTHLAMRPRRPAKPRTKAPAHKEGDAAASADANGSHRTR